MGSPKILVVDDDRSLRELLRSLLEDEGYAVMEAENGAAALPMVAHERPDLILLDLAMPVMDGRTFLERCRDHECQGIPVIAVSALSEAHTLSADAALTKPFEIETLVREVERLVQA